MDGYLLSQREKVQADFLASIATQAGSFTADQYEVVSSFANHIKNQYLMSRGIAEGVIPVEIGESDGAANDTPDTVREWHTVEADRLESQYAAASALLSDMGAELGG